MAWLWARAEDTACTVRRGVRLCMRAATSMAITCATFVAAGAACVADPLPYICPELSPGELVITEIRGNLQDSATATSTGGSDSSDGSAGTTSGMEADADRGRDWVEFTSLLGVEVDLHGLSLRNAQLTGTNEVFMRVRYHRELAANGVYVLGLVHDEERPQFVDYGVGDAFPKDEDANLHPSGSLQLLACDVEVDTVLYNALPSDGTWSFGVSPPDADANDMSSAWCDDSVLTVVDGQEEPGTPGEANRPCD